MNGKYIELGYVHLAWCAGAFLLASLSSVALRLGVFRTLLVAAARMTSQLFFIGWALHWLIDRASIFWTLLAALLITMIAGISAAGRATAGRYLSWVSAAVCIATGAWSIVIFSTVFVLRPDQWHDARFLIPLLGMILGNSVTAVSLSVERCIATVAESRRLIESMLALGADAREASLLCFRDSIQAGLTPVINQMMVAGIVTLPGMMTGQILSGIEVSEAVLYQIAIMFLIATSSLISSVLATRIAILRHFTRDHRLRMVER